MARVRSTARVSREGDDAEVTETTSISEVMRRPGLVVSKEDVVEGETTEAEQNVVEDRSDDENEEYNSILSPSKPSHIEFERSTMSAENMVMMKKLGYFEEDESKLIHFAGEEVILEPKEDEFVVFKSFFRGGFGFL
jgi:predicted Mrr-cat superfamily restriction endonuclease